MEIRVARECDLEALLDIYNYEAINSTATFAVNTKTLSERKTWFEEHNRDHHPLIVAVKEGTAVGYASLSAFRSNEAYAKTVELSVYVDHRHRGEGIGEALMIEILNTASADEDVHAVMSVITAGNEASVKLHEKLGFVHCGSLKEVGEKYGRWLDTVYYQLLV